MTTLNEATEAREELDRQIAEACDTWLSLGDKFRTSTMLVALMRNVIADLAPRPAEAMDDAAVDALADKIAGENYLHPPQTIALLAIRETLKRSPRWPSDAVAAGNVPNMEVRF
jgi:hypothetical protein